MVLFIEPFGIKRVFAEEEPIVTDCRAYVLIDKNSKNVLVENNASEKMPVASIVKLMTILLTLEEIDAGKLALSDKICVSENASSMGGSQVFLDANAEYEVGNLLKSVIIASANDSSVALAEHIAGSEQLFVQKMNDKAKSLGLKNTNYENATGLPSVNQYSCALDVAKILSEVLNYETYRNYAKIWMEDFVHPSNRITEMANTNKLSRFYDGCIGGKTGSTNEAKYCLSVGAERNGMGLVAVVLGCNDSKIRFAKARELLDYGFANYENKTVFDNSNLDNVVIKMRGQDKELKLKVSSPISITTKKGEELKVEYIYNLPTALDSVKENDIVGNVDIIVNGKKLSSIDILAMTSIDAPTYLDYLSRVEDEFVR